ncbi:hypothetical protein GCM10023149_54120 [Mucilaginibacter gynuensis]|uniref:40S ribosomal protein S19 n=1 Tax=Mucilaginibacter gynuensis TaxID=1302236 RepID=A0ABP8HNE7_9SPHI
MASNVQQVNMHDAVKGWAEVTIDRFHEALEKYGIGKIDGPLMRSLTYQLVQANGDVERVILKFKQYGRFIDMRVGRGMPISKKGTSDRGVRYGRRKKPWYSKTKTREVAILREVLVRDYGVNTLANIESAFAGTQIINPL